MSRRRRVAAPAASVSGAVLDVPSSGDRRGPPPLAVDRVAVSSGPIAAIWILASDAGVRRIVMRRRRAGFTAWAHELAGVSRVRSGSSLTRSMIAELSEYFDGRLRAFTTPIDLERQGTRFQQLVWRALLEVPYGETRSYGDIARAIRRPRASRPVGQAVGWNPLPIVVPCHRIVAGDGAIGGFTGGLDLKRALLRVEGRSW